MGSRNLPLPYFPNPPANYSQAFFAEFLRAFSTYMAQAQNPGEGRATFMVFTDLSTNDAGLEPGTVFQVNGVLRVSLPNTPYPAGNSMSVSVGSVTVVV
jgi:hypothetical protein